MVEEIRKSKRSFQQVATGIGFRDVTIETVVPYFTKTFDGFGELFRYLTIRKMSGRKRC